MQQPVSNAADHRSNAEQKPRTAWEFYASCPEGFERALANELRALDVPQVRPLKGRVNFGGAVEGTYRVCLWSRLASRVYALIARFDCPDAEALYRETKAQSWEGVIARGSSIAVSAHGVNDSLRNTQFTALRVKDAICDHLVEYAGLRPNVDTEHPDVRIVVSVHGARASLHIDLAGEPLFKRLPRAAARPGSAPVLRPDYAALLLAQADWQAACRSEGATPLLVDTACSGGGVELEAASILADRAPGITRTTWGFEGWEQHEPAIWQKLLDEAVAREEAATSRSGVIIATDPNGSAADFARRIVRKAGYARFVTFTAPDSRDIQNAVERGVPYEGAHIRGLIAADTTATPPARLAATLTLIRQVRSLGALEELPAVALSRNDPIASALGAEPAETIVVKPNNEEADLAVFAPAADEESADASPATFIDLGDGAPVPVLIPESEQFAHRLRKNARRLRKWAAREDVTCYRVYDADLPDYSAAIDLYQGSAATPGRWLVIAEYAAPDTVDASLARARFLDILTIAPRILGVDPEHVRAKARMRSRGGSQYGKAARSPRTSSRGTGALEIRDRHLPLIEEGGLTFAVDFDDYLDTGIFLDHRITRALIRERARDARFFLNLFAYTGTATCYAADAGVEETVTVDLSNTYLDWAERNMGQNGFTGREHHYVRADVRRWIDEQRRTRNRWDLIFCDPPTFSNSTKMGHRSFDVQRDHAELIIGLSRLLTRDGEAIFSCNLRTFRPDIEKMARAGVVLTDITNQTIPEDFARNKRIHRCYIVRRYTPEEAMRRAGIS